MQTRRCLNQTPLLAVLQMSYIGSEVFVIIIFLAYQTPMYTEGDNLIALIFLVLLFGWVAEK